MQLLRDNLVNYFVLVKQKTGWLLTLRQTLWTSSEAEPSAESGPAPPESKEATENPPAPAPEKAPE